MAAEAGQAARGLRRAARALRFASLRRFDPAEWLARQIEREEAARTGFHLLAVATMLGAALVFGAGLRLHPAWLLAAAALLLLGASALAGRSVRLAALLGVALFGGMALSEWEVRRTTTTLLSGTATTRVEGLVLERDQDARGRFRYLLKVLRTERPTLSRPPEEVRILVGSRHEPIDPGELFVGLVRIGPPSGPAYPGAYDFAFGPFFSGLGAHGFSLRAPERRPASLEQLSLADRAGLRLVHLRMAMTERIQTAIGGASGAIAAALITGERAAIPDEVEEWLRITGLAHVLSISGLHMAIVAGVTMAFVRALLCLSPLIALTLPVKKIAAVAAILVATFYMLLSGGNVATTRSYVMLLVMLLAILCDRPAVTLRNLSIAAFVCVALTPHAVVTASFQMSFAATAALVGAYTALQRWLNDRRLRRDGPEDGKIRRAGRQIAAVALSSLVAGAATAPYGAYHFQTMAPLGFVANVLAAPLFGFWIMPLALVSALAMPFGLDAPFLIALGWGLDLVLWIAEVLAAWFPMQRLGPATGIGLLLLTFGLLALSILSSGFRWLAVPLFLLGLFAFPDRRAPPSLLVFEDGLDVALVGEDGSLTYLKPRPSRFVAEQWERAFDSHTDTTGRKTLARDEIDCGKAWCAFTTRDGLRVVWTDELELVGAACDAADLVIAARALRLDRCRTGAELVTLRTLRRSGSLAIGRDEAEGRIHVARSISDPPAAWNRHRLEPWPERWRREDESGGAVSSGGSGPPASPEP